MQQRKVNQIKSKHSHTHTRTHGQTVTMMIIIMTIKYLRKLRSLSHDDIKNHFTTSRLEIEAKHSSDRSQVFL